MAETIGGAIRAAIVGADLFGARVWTGDDAPPNATLPYSTIGDMLALNPALRGDGGRAMGLRRLVQVDVWQARRRKASEGGGIAEDYLLPKAVYDLLDGLRVTLDEDRGRVWRIHVDDMQRIPAGRDDNLVHHALTLSVKHDRGAI